MEMPQVSPIGAVLFIAFSLAYIIICFIVQYKFFSRRCKQAELFCEQAEQDGRMVTAHLKGFRHLSDKSDKNHSRYAGNYT